MIKINLLPREILEKGKGSDWIILGYGVIFVFVVFALTTYTLKLNTYKKNLAKKQVWTAQLQEIKSKVAKVNELDGQKSVLNAKKNTVVQLLQGRLLYPKTMEAFFNTLPKEVWISNMTLAEDSQKNIKITAVSESLTTDAIADWLQGLESKSDRFTDVILSAIDAKVDTSGKQSSYGFTITFVYHPPSEPV